MHQARWQFVGADLWLFPTATNRDANTFLASGPSSGQAHWLTVQISNPQYWLPDGCWNLMARSHSAQLLCTVPKKPNPPCCPEPLLLRSKWHYDPEPALTANVTVSHLDLYSSIDGFRLWQLSLNSSLKRNAFYNNLTLFHCSFVFCRHIKIIVTQNKDSRAQQK